MMGRWRYGKTSGANERTMSENVAMRFVAWQDVRGMGESRVVLKSRISERNRARIFEFLQLFSLRFSEGRRKAGFAIWIGGRRPGFPRHDGKGNAYRAGTHGPSAVDNEEKERKKGVKIVNWAGRGCCGNAAVGSGAMIKQSVGRAY